MDNQIWRASWTQCHSRRLLGRETPIKIHSMVSLLLVGLILSQYLRRRIQGNAELFVANSTEIRAQPPPGYVPPMFLQNYPQGGPVRHISHKQTQS